MKAKFFSLLVFALLAPISSLFSQCEAEFTWEQLPGTLTIHFTSTSVSEHDIVTYLWIFGDGQNGDGANPNHTYAEPGTYNACLVITDSEGCISDVCHMIVVEAINNCEAAFVWEQGMGLTVHFIDQSDDDPDIVSWLWNFGDGHVSDDPNPIHTYAEPGVYLVCLTVENEFGCEDDVCHEVVVEGGGSDCEAAFTWETNGLVVHFIDQSDDDPDIVSWLWNFGDGHLSDDPNPVHTYAEPGVYVVCLTVENEFGCEDDVCHEVVVEQPQDCEAEFTWDQGNGLIVHFFDQSDNVPGIISWLWNFGDGHMSDDPDPVHEYAAPGVYVVCLIIENEIGCVSDVCHEVVVEEGGGGDCEAAFVWEQGNGLVVHFIDQSDDDPDIVSWIWNFGDGHMGDGQNPVHEYAEPGVYVVCLIITNEFGCMSDVCHEVVVEEEACEALFEYHYIENNTIIVFENYSTGGSAHTTWLWDFGDGNTSTEENPSHMYEEPGVYVVCLTMTDTVTECVDDICHEVAYQLGNAELIMEDNIPKVRTRFNISAFNKDVVLERFTSPAHNMLKIEYTVEKPSDVSFMLSGVNGQQILVQDFGYSEKGSYSRRLDISDLLPGIYFIHLYGGQSFTTRTLLITE